MKKSMYGCLLTLCLMWFCTSFVLAASEYTEGYFKYRIEDSSVIIYEYFGSEKEVTVPSLIAGNPVNVIATGAFSSESGVEKVNLPDSIMTIERNAIGQGIQVVYNSNTDNPIKSGSDQSKEIQREDEKIEKEISDIPNIDTLEEDERKSINKTEQTENTENSGKTRNERSNEAQAETKNTEKIDIENSEENTRKEDIESQENNEGKEVNEKSDSGFDEAEISLNDSFSEVDKGITVEKSKKDKVIILVVLCLIIIGIGGLWYYKKKRRL